MTLSPRALTLGLCGAVLILFAGIWIGTAANRRTAPAVRAIPVPVPAPILQPIAMAPVAVPAAPVPQVPPPQYQSRPVAAAAPQMPFVAPPASELPPPPSMAGTGATPIPSAIPPPPQYAAPHQPVYTDPNQYMPGTATRAPAPIVQQRPMPARIPIQAPRPSMVNDRIRAEQAARAARVAEGERVLARSGATVMDADSMNQLLRRKQAQAEERARQEWLQRGARSAFPQEYFRARPRP